MYRWLTSLNFLVLGLSMNATFTWMLMCFTSSYSEFEQREARALLGANVIVLPPPANGSTQMRGKRQYFILYLFEAGLVDEVHTASRHRSV